MTHYDPDLTEILTRDIQRSYAALLFRGWLSREIHAEKDGAEIPQQMAMVMETSIVQLKSTYTSIDRGDNDRTVKCTVSAFTKMIDSDSRDDQPGEDTCGQQQLDIFEIEEHDQSSMYFETTNVKDAENDARKSGRLNISTSKSTKLEKELPSSSIQKAALENKERDGMST